MMALLSANEGVCLYGKWKGWLFKKDADGKWVSVRKLEIVNPMEGNPLAALLSNGGERP